MSVSKPVGEAPGVQPGPTKAVPEQKGVIAGKEIHKIPVAPEQMSAEQKTEYDRYRNEFANELKNQYFDKPYNFIMSFAANYERKLRSTDEPDRATMSRLPPLAKRALADLLHDICPAYASEVAKEHASTFGATPVKGYYKEVSASQTNWGAEVLNPSQLKTVTVGAKKKQEVRQETYSDKVLNTIVSNVLTRHPPAPPPRPARPFHVEITAVPTSAAKVPIPKAPPRPSRPASPAPIAKKEVKPEPGSTPKKVPPPRPKSPPPPLQPFPPKKK